MNSLKLISVVVTSYLYLVEGRITLGEPLIYPISVKDYPWVVLIEYPNNNTNSLSCEGALISDRYVLTAAHCVVGPLIDSAPPLNVVLGEYYTSNEYHQQDCEYTKAGGYECTDGAVVIPIEKIIPHPDYDFRDRKTMRHDIALSKMSKSANYTDFIRPISLPTYDMTLSPPSDWQLIEAGWGGAKFYYGESYVKMDLKLPFVSFSECQAAYAAQNSSIELWQGQICAGAQDLSCDGGDGGGPLMWENPKGKDFEVVGIISFGSIRCGMKYLPTVYTKVYDYNSWINETIKS